MSLSDLSFHKHVLPNGLTVIGEHHPAAHTAAVGYFVRAGARDEDAKLMGVSHFLEHMMFKGTDRRSADDVNREFDEIGANYNAYTSQEVTAYFAQILPEFLPRAVDLLSDMLRPALRDDDFEMEKKVILEEISMYDDRPSDRLQDVLLESYFGSHPLGYRVLGHKETVSALTATQMRGYFEQRYSPDNMVLSLAGKFDFDAVVKQVEQATAHWRPTRVTRKYTTPAFTHVARDLTDPSVNRHYLMMICPGPSSQDPLRYAARIAADVLGDSEGSRLYWALVDPGLADAADVSHYPQDQLGNFFAYASCDPDRADQVRDALLKTLDGYAGSLDEDEISRVKNKIATLATLQGENPGGRMRGLGNQWLYLGEYTPLSQELDRIMDVTRQDVAELLSKYSFSPRTVLRMGPGAADAAADGQGK